VKIDSQISGLNRLGTEGVQDSQIERGRSSQQSTVPNDTVQLSSEQTTLRRLTTQLQQVPEVRSDRVQALRTQIQSGTFHGSNQQVAGALVNELTSGR
jgi:flagellar biosynthesis anti-sigma factor FlgM